MEAPPVNPIPTAAPQPVAFNPNEAISRLSEQGYRIYDKDYVFDPSKQTDDTFIKSIVGATSSNLYVGIDKDLFESTGIPKNQGEKTFEYQKRVAAQLKDQIAKAPDVDKVTKDYEDKLRAKDAQIAEISLRGALSGLKLNVDATAMDQMQELLLNKALLLPHRIEGQQIVFQKYAADGTTLIDVIDPVTGKPEVPAKFLEAQFKPFLKAEQPVAQGPGKTPKPADTTKAIPKNLDELANMLIQEGFSPGPLMTAEVKKRAIEFAIALQ